MFVSLCVGVFVCLCACVCDERIGEVEVPYTPPGSVTLMLQRCYKGVTQVLQGCYKGVTLTGHTH
jgi:hypothetical protein